MAYTAFDPTKPNGSQLGTALPGSANTNDLALWYGIVQGGSAPGYAFAPTVGTGSAEQPQYFTWTNGAYKVRATNTWTSGNLTQQVWDVSTDTGGTWANICTQVLGFDGSGNLTSTTGAGGMLDWMKALLGQFKATRDDVNTHITNQVSGRGDHGLGTMSVQNMVAVDIDGGSIDGTPVGTTTPAEGRFTRAIEGSASYAPASGAGVTLSWANGGSILTNNGTNVLTFSNVPAAPRVGVHVLYCTNLANTTFPAAVTWGLGGKPAVAGAACVTMVTFDGGTTVLAGLLYRAV